MNANGGGLRRVTAVIVVANRWSSADGHAAELSARVRAVARVVGVGDAVAAIERNCPDVVVVELASAEPLHQLSVLVQAKAPVLVVSSQPVEHALLPCLAAGVRGYLQRPADVAAIDLAVATVAAGHTFVDPRVAHWLVELALHGCASRTERGLTLRQAQVVQLAHQGLSNREIAGLLRISPETVKSHMRSAMRALGVSDRVRAGASFAEPASSRP